MTVPTIARARVGKQPSVISVEILSYPLHSLDNAFQTGKLYTKVRNEDWNYSVGDLQLYTFTVSHPKKLVPFDILEPGEVFLCVELDSIKGLIKVISPHENVGWISPHGQVFKEVTPEEFEEE